MDSTDSISNAKEELAYIGNNVTKILFFTFSVSIITSLLLCSSINSQDCILSNFLFTFGMILFVLGLLLSCYYSSFSLGFDAIWTPQLQGEIQRDERKRQISGWSRAFTGGIIFLIGIIILYMYINLYIL